jgi:predicted membrane GTPase involved in stress response
LSPADAASLRLEGETHPEFPLERLCSHLYEPFQLTFARNAQQHFVAREDVEVAASHQGLTIRGETEDSIDAATVILKDLYGPDLRIGPPTIRYHLGRSLEQPWMGVRIKCKPEHLDAVNADLIDREAEIVSCDIESAQSVIQARAPLASLLGYRLALEMITSGTAQHAIWLSHYAPIENTPPDGEAA